MESDDCLSYSEKKITRKIISKSVDTQHLSHKIDGTLVSKARNNDFDFYNPLLCTHIYFVKFICESLFI